PVAFAAAKPAASHARAAGLSAGHAPPRAPALQPNPLPGRQAASYTVTLITGDRVTLNAAAPGRYAISAALASSPTLRITAQGSPGGVNRLYAVPADAAGLITAGRVDKSLFDVAWLAAHGDTGLGARLPVMLQYGGHPDAATLARNAAALPGATVLATLPGSSAVEVSVTLGRAAGFWAALTSHAGAAIPATPAGAYRTASPGLADGITRVWLAGHVTSTAVRPQAGQAEYTVTETVERTAGQAFECNASPTTMCETGGSLYGVAGAGADNGYSATSIACASPSPCTTWRVTYSVPAGVYMFDDEETFYVAGAPQNVDMADPQLTVAGNTAIRFNTDQAKQVSISTPRPNDSFDGSYEEYRTLPDGSYDASYTFSAYGTQNFWATPATQPVTIGTYHSSSAWLLGEPPVTMTVDTPAHLTLHPLYPDYATTSGPIVFTRFSGRRAMPLVYAGTGSKQDLSGLDVHGKLVLIHIGVPGGGSCGTPSSYGTVQRWQLNDLLQAGAAGVLVDPTNGNPQQWCSLPIYPGWFGTKEKPVDIPYAAIPAAEASALLDLLSHGPVQVTVSDGGPSPYVYDLKFYQESPNPGSLHYTVTSQQLAGVNARYHVGQSSLVTSDDGVFAANEYLVTANGFDSMTVPNSLREYVGPVSPALVHFRDAAATGAQAAGLTTFDVFGQAGSRTEDWFEQPEAPGAAAAPTDVLQAQPGKWVGLNATEYCSFCRQGNTFYPATDLVSGADPRLRDGPYVFTPGSVHLYQGSQEIQPTPVSGIVTYQLPPARAWYRLTTAYDSTYTDWRFSSSEPAKNAVPEGYTCLGTFLGVPKTPCRPDPLIFLRYDVFPDRANAVTAPGTHQMQVTAYYQAASAPAVTSLKLWTSTDGGASWQPAEVTGQGHGTYTVAYQVSALARTSGTVSIRAQASDAAGDAVYQTIYNAFGLTAAPSA
ncbi:MAG: hypothetical protein ACRDRJ_12605, partial [Streptosporangiaceae bacterium]